MKKKKTTAHKPTEKKNVKCKATVATKKETAKKQTAKTATAQKAVTNTTAKKTSSKQATTAPKATVSKPAPKTQTPASVHKRGTKADYMAKNGIKIRPVTAKDRQYARTDYQRTADYIISIKGKEYFSTNGSLADCKAVVQLNKQQPGGQNGKK